MGAGPAGLEAARALGQRGYTVTVADSASEAGGRVAQERRLPGLAEWGRVVDYRLYQIGQMSNVSLYLESEMTPDALDEFGADHVALATGARWNADGIGRQNPRGIAVSEAANVLTPDSVMAGAVPEGPVVVFDDDHFYIGGAVAEMLLRAGADVTFVTPAPEVSSWTHHTLEQHAIQKRLLDLGAKILCGQNIAAIDAQEVTLQNVYNDASSTQAAEAVVLVTMRTPVDTLWQSRPEIARIGDAFGPSTIAAAVYSGHRYARELDAEPTNKVPFRRELVELSPT